MVYRHVLAVYLSVGAHVWVRLCEPTDLLELNSLYAANVLTASNVHASFRVLVAMLTVYCVQLLHKQYKVVLVRDSKSNFQWRACVYVHVHTYVITFPKLIKDKVKQHNSTWKAHFLFFSKKKWAAPGGIRTHVTACFIPVPLPLSYQGSSVVVGWIRQYKAWYMYIV